MSEPESSASPDDRSRSIAGVTELGTWAALLGHWTALVQAGEALHRAAPGDPDSARWRQSIPELVTLQSVTFALGDLDRLAIEDRPLARDRADLAVTAAAGRLDEAWRGEEMPASILEIAEDARRAVEGAVYAGLRWIVWNGPGPGRMPAMDPADDPDRGRGTLALMLEGTIVLPGEPVAWWTDRARPTGFEGPAWKDVPGPPVQVYRELDDSGRFRRDLVVGLDRLPPGLPLVAPRSLDGTAIGTPATDPVAWAAANDAAFAGVDAPEVRWEVEGLDAESPEEG